jgi:hypothetical protein
MKSDGLPRQVRDEREESEQLRAFLHSRSYLKTHPRYCWGTEGGGNAWGHARSPDLLHWEVSHSTFLMKHDALPSQDQDTPARKTQNDGVVSHAQSMPVSGMCASSGGGVTLPPGFRGPHGEKWRSAMIGSGGTAHERTGACSGQHSLYAIGVFLNLSMRFKN